LLTVGGMAAGPVLPVPSVVEGGQAQGADQTGQDEGVRVIAVFDFESAFDGGTLGKFAANNFRAKIVRYKLFTTMEDDDREEAEGLAGFEASYDMKPEKALAFAKKSLQADLVMLGKVEQAGGEALRVAVKVYDQKLGPAKARLATSVDVPTKYAIQVGVFKILAELTGRKDPRYRPLPPDAEERWKRGPNLLRYTGFEKGGTHPLGWEPFGVDWQMNQAHWEKNPDEPGKCIVFRMSRGVAAMEGVAYYSRFFNIQPGATYRVQLRVKSMAPTVKVFVKYYAWLHTATEPKGQWREVGRSPLNCKGPKRQWGTHRRECRPKVYLTRAKRTYTPKKCRIGLYAYWPEGVVYFDDVVFKKIASAPKSAPKPYDVGEIGRQPQERKE
jgi:hypothetical protein